MDKIWLCLQTYGGQELVLAAALNQISVPAYAPKYQLIKKVFYSTKAVDRPFFPTYLFASVEYYDRRASVNLLPVSMKARVVGELDEDVLDLLWEREENGYIVLSKAEREKTINRPFAKGDMVLYSGIGTNFEAVFDSYLSDDERCIILTTMFNQQQRVPVLISDLTLAAFAQA
jgi:hypothetical protein